MMRGTTPTIRIRVLGDVKVSELGQCHITVEQRAYSSCCPCVTRFDITDVELDEKDNSVLCMLTQEQTLSLRPGNVDVQMRCVAQDGTAVATQVFTIRVDDILKDGLIQYE